jgi:hypothetical protein
MVKSVLQNTVVSSIKYHICSYIQITNLAYFLFAGIAILCLTSYKNSNKFVRSDDSLNELSKTDDYQLTKCFHSLIRWNIAM